MAQGNKKEADIKENEAVSSESLNRDTEGVKDESKGTGTEGSNTEGSNTEEHSKRLRLVNRDSIDLGREERRLLEKLEKESSGRDVQIRCEVPEDAPERQAIYNASEEVFMLAGKDNEDIDVRALSAYLLSQYGQRHMDSIYKFTAERFDLREIIADKGKGELKEYEKYLWKLTSDKELYLMVLQMSKISNIVAYKIINTAIQKVSDVVIGGDRDNYTAIKKKRKPCKVVNGNIDSLLATALVWWALRCGMCVMTDTKLAEHIIDSPLTKIMRKILVPTKIEKYAGFLKNKDSLAESIRDGDSLSEITDEDTESIKRSYNMQRYLLAEICIKHPAYAARLAEFEKAKNSAVTAKKKLEETREKYNKLKTDVKQIKKDVAENNADKVDKEQKIKEKDKEIAEKSKEIEEKKAEISKIEAIAKELKAKLKEAEASKNENASKGNAELEAKVKELEGIVEKRDKESRIKDSQIEAMKNTIKILSKKLNIANNKIEALVKI